MKKIIAAAAAAAVLCAAVLYFCPEMIKNSAPACETLAPVLRSFCETVSGSGELCYAAQHEITCALPVVIKRLYVSEGDEIKAGDLVALVDREATAAYIESLARINMLSVAAADLQAAASLIPETITSDCQGKVISVCGNGRAVPSGTGICAVAAGSELLVVTAVSELDIAKVKEGQPARFSLAAYPDKIYFGKVESISGSARSQYNGAVLETVVDVKILPDAPDERLRAGLSADVYIKLSEPKDIIVLPYSAIDQDDKGEYVYVYENEKAVRRNVFTGTEFSDGAEIKKGLEIGDIVFENPKKISESKFIRIEKN